MGAHLANPTPAAPIPGNPYALPQYVGNYSEKSRFANSWEYQEMPTNAVNKRIITILCYLVLFFFDCLPLYLVFVQVSANYPPLIS